MRASDNKTAETLRLRDARAPLVLVMAEKSRGEHRVANNSITYVRRYSRVETVSFQLQPGLFLRVCLLSLSLSLT